MTSPHFDKFAYSLWNPIRILVCPRAKKFTDFLSFLEKEARYLRQEVREKAQDIKDELGGKVESAAQEVQRVQEEEVQELGGRPNSSAGGQLLDFFCISITSKVFSL